MSHNPAPSVLCFSGFDPSGGAGIQADIEAIVANNVRPLSIITATTVQNTAKVIEVVPMDADLIYRQAMCLLEESRPDVIKLGMLTNIATIKIINKIIKQLPKIPLVIDPVFYSGNNDKLFNENIVDWFELLFDKTELLVPNQSELTELGGVKKLLKSGVNNILLTTTDSTTDENIRHIWYNKTIEKIFEYQRLPYQYHGSGCTLASSISANIAKKQPIGSAIQHGLDYTFHALKNAENFETHQRIPKRKI